MNRYTFVFVLGFCLLVACSARNKPGEISPDADPEQLPDLVGTYVVNGVDPLGDEYGGHLTITPGDQPNTYNMQWIITGSIQEGLGMVKGIQLIVEWQTIEGIESAAGTAVYTITELGQLNGIRTSDSLQGEGQEQAYPND